MELTVLEYQVRDNVALITMNHPPVNALGTPFLDDMDTVLRRLHTPGEAGAVVLRSACPGFFSAGDDVSTLEDLDDDIIDTLKRAHDTLGKFENLPLPTVAAINGFALGGGLELALVCDFRFMASGSARIGLPEVRLGLIPALGGTQRLPLLIGKARAVEMMFKGLQITAQQAKDIGLVNDVFDAEGFEDRCFDYARALARQATGAIAWIKKCVNIGLTDGVGAGLAAEVESFGENIGSPDAREGIEAFLSGRKPVFKG